VLLFDIFIRAVGGGRLVVVILYLELGRMEEYNESIKERGGKSKKDQRQIHKMIGTDLVLTS